MKKTLLPALLPLSLMLTQCAEPMPYGPGPGQAQWPGGGYNDPNQRIEMREQGNDLNRMAYERGLQDGRGDAQQRQGQNYTRNSTRFDQSTEMAYRDGYNQGYSQTGNSLNGYPNQGPGTPPPPTRDAGYNQGYDYGLRDLTSGRTADPAAHVGRYDPRQRASFERGYYDAYNSRSGGQGGGGSSLDTSSIPWYRR